MTHTRKTTEAYDFSAPKSISSMSDAEFKEHMNSSSPAEDLERAGTVIKRLEGKRDWSLLVDPEVLDLAVVDPDSNPMDSWIARDWNRCFCTVAGLLCREYGYQPGGWFAVFDQVVQVLEFGVHSGYQRASWQQVPASMYVAAAARHIAAYESGEELDTDSGLPHLAHALCDLYFLVWMDKHGNR